MLRTKIGSIYVGQGYKFEIIDILSNGYALVSIICTPKNAVYKVGNTCKLQIIDIIINYDLVGVV